MTDHRIRPWIKQRLADSNDARQAYRIWERWKSARAAAKNVARAIRIYDTLLKGDGAAFHKMMVEFFPGYGMSLGASKPVVDLDATSPAPAVHVANNRPKPAQVIVTKAAHDEDLEEDDDLGFGSLEIGG